MDNGKLLDENAAALESLELIRGVRKEGRASTLGSACAAWACRHLSQRGRLGAAKKVVEGLMAEGEAREVAGAAGVLLKLLVREGRYKEAFEVAGHFVPKQPGAGPSGLVSNDALTSLVVASGAVGGGSLALDTWHALASSAGGRGKPSEGSYRALLGACARADAQLLGSGEPILAPGTSTSRALEVGSALDYGVGSHTASVLLDSCSAAGDVSRVLELHGAQNGLGRGEGGRDLGGHGDAYGRRGFPLLVSVTSFVGGTAGLSSHLLSSLVKALFRSGRSGEAFAAVRGAAAGGSRAALAGPEPFAALVRGSAAMGAAWPMLRALELCEKHWHRPSTASAHTVLGAISRRSSPSDDPNLRRRVLDLLDPQRAARDEGYFLLDTLSYFSGNDPPSREADGAELGALEGQSPPQAGAGYFASGSHIDQTLTWRVYEKLLLTRPTRKGVRALVRRLHAAGASDFLILDRAFRALGEEPLEARRADLAAHVVAVLMHPRVERKDAVLDFVQEIHRRGLVLDSGTLALAALALDTRERVAKPGAVRSVLRMAYESQSLTPELEANLSSAVSAALSSATHQPSGLLKRSTEDLLVDLGVAGVYREAVEAGKPGCEVLCRTCGAALRSLRTAGREGPFGAFGEAVDRTA